ncbi:MAG TPA: mandelate racemase/muconate lactonizing enzyme family protein [Gaiellaceae bacterium]|nr:mandelate racemase/muconate lactonizing enzyme family protein [Gaiellaceae bacterium]
MKIERVRLERRSTELDPPFHAAWDPEPRRFFEATLVLVETDEGLTGIGSGDTMDGFERYEHLFVDTDPLAIERHVAVLETLNFHAGRYWPLEAALWDLAGKAAGKPVAELLGGQLTRIPAYASTGEQRSPVERAESALRLRDEGFKALKVRIDRSRLDEGLAAVAAVRDAVGDTMEIMVDLNQGWRMPGDIGPALAATAVGGVARRLRDLDVFWLEEPLPREDVQGYATLRRESGLRIAGGEMARTSAELEAFEAADALDVYQPDAVLSRGLLRERELAERVTARGHFFTPHTWTNGIGLLANLHLTAGVGGGPYLEFPYDPPGWTPGRRDFMLAEPVRVDGEGFLAIPGRPGLGFDLADDLL